MYEIPLYRVWIPIVSCMKSYREWNLSYRVWNPIVSCILIYCAFVFSFRALNPFYRSFCEKLTLICCLQCNHFTSSLTLKIFCTQVWLYYLSIFRQEYIFFFLFCLYYILHKVWYVFERNLLWIGRDEFNCDNCMLVSKPIIECIYDGAFFKDHRSSSSSST